MSLKVAYKISYGQPIFQYLELMEYKYSKAAVKSNCYVIGACGFDSIPNDMGVVFCRKKFPGSCCVMQSCIATHR